MSNSEHKTDVAIIGAGPVGLFAVFQCGMLRMSCHVIDALEGVGGQCAALYPDKPIYDIPGYPRILAHALVEHLHEQAEPFSPCYHLNQQVVHLSQGDDTRWLVETSAGVSIDAAVVIIAAGVGAFGPNRPPLPGIEDYENAPLGLGVKYFIKSRDDFRGRRVVIAGGGDSAVDWALALSDIAESVSVVHRRQKFRAAPESVRKMRELEVQGKLELLIPYQLSCVEGSNGILTTVKVSDLDGHERCLDVDALLPFYGLSQKLGPIAEWELNLHRNHIVVDPATCRAGRPGLFAIGDIVSYPGKLKLILTGFAEAAHAAHSAYSAVHPDEELHFEYSTTQGVPGLS